MKELKKIKIFCLVGVLFVSIFGAISHFFYDWSGKNEIVGILFPANESTWEHLKLALVPTFIYFGIGSIFIKNKNYIFAMFVCLIVPMLLIPAIFYAYTSFSKASILIVDILTFFISVFVAWLISYLILKTKPLNKIFNVIGVIGISVIMLAYLTFTFFPPHNILFKDPNEFYGFKC